MRIAPLLSLMAVTLIQIVLASFLSVFALKASVTHQRVAELYAEKVRLSEKTVPVMTLQLQTEAVAASDHNLTVCLYLALAIVALAFVQLWLATDMWRTRKSQLRPVS